MVKYTAKVRRGLALMGWVCHEVMEDEASAQATMKKWSAARHSDFQAACRWVAQEVQTPSIPIVTAICACDDGANDPDKTGMCLDCGRPTELVPGEVAE